jgi:hypothetical protein
MKLKAIFDAHSRKTPRGTSVDGVDVQAAGGRKINHLRAASCIEFFYIRVRSHVVTYLG